MTTAQATTELSAPGPVEVDDAPLTDHDSLFYESSSASTSITSSVLAYKYENGRRYHAFREGNYPLPNDEREQDRLDLFHHITKLNLDGELFLAPLGPSPQRALDFGTGTGIWALEFADLHPGCDVIGTDLSPIQPSWVPPNCHFLVDDVEAEWQFDAPFDFVHGRTMSGSIGDWPRLYGQIYKNLKPGGWVEMQEFEIKFQSDDGAFERAPTFAQWEKDLMKASQVFGKELETAQRQAGWMKDAGFVNVVDDKRPSPVGPWPKNRKLKEIGRYNVPHCMDAVESFTLALFTRVLGYTVEECQVLISKLKAELRDPKVHMYWYYHFIYGQKPEDTK
ncbi:putative tam domain methyltransferase protein [Neofusicoccum parvum]|uniref:Putative tam domain methyltransferase protein n=1 Tax=Botryosphaeria parva (strain UCR-NP2) TaxID=1287680 RepID=R1GNQ2_BOTPV|nr:putative tam domain methyltransferase protein [Neofusicoccum parvum UCRNP2]GME65069.1 putative tam domain methyltransferase protein [Neofusicoccum parvum]